MSIDRKEQIRTFPASIQAAKIGSYENMGSPEWSDAAWGFEQLYDNGAKLIRNGKSKQERAKGTSNRGGRKAKKKQLDPATAYGIKQMKRSATKPGKQNSKYVMKKEQQSFRK